MKVGGQDPQGRRPDLDRRLDRRGDARGACRRARPRSSRSSQGKLKPEKSPLYQKFEKLLELGRRGPPARHPRQRRHPARRQGGLRASARAASASAAPSTCSSPRTACRYVVKMILAAARGQRGIDVTGAAQGAARGGARARRRRRSRRSSPRSRRSTASTSRTTQGALKKLAADAAGRLRRPLQGDARLAGHHPHARPAAARVPAQARGADGRGRDAARAGRREEQERTIAAKEKLLRAVEELHEFNPMLGHRGCRLGITYPEITRMQARAIFEAALQVVEEGHRRSSPR